MDTKCSQALLKRLLERISRLEQDVAEIKQTYLTCRRCLHRDLHLAPAVETTMLYHQLIQQSTPLSVH